MAKVTSRELKYYLNNTLLNSNIDFLHLAGNIDLVDAGMSFYEFVDMMEQIMYHYKVLIPRQDWNQLSNLSRIVKYINNTPNELEIDDSFMDKIRDMYRRD